MPARIATSRHRPPRSTPRPPRSRRFLPPRPPSPPHFQRDATQIYKQDRVSEKRSSETTSSPNTHELLSHVRPGGRAALAKDVPPRLLQASPPGTGTSPFASQKPGPASGITGGYVTNGDDDMGRKTLRRDMFPERRAPSHRPRHRITPSTLASHPNVREMRVAYENGD